MGLLYLFLGLMVVFTIHHFMRWLANAPPTHAKRAIQWVAIILAIIVALLLARFGAPVFALLMGAVAFVGIWMRRLAAIAPFWTLFRAHTTRARPASPPPAARMTDQEARDILGVGKDATTDDIKNAYQQLMKQYHPDQGGSEYFARRLNEARDHLLKS